MHAGGSPLAAWENFYALTSLFGVAGAALLLLFVGIHNAWDTATYIAANRGPSPSKPNAPD